MKIYTKFGDRGETALFDGTRVPKDHLRIETYGTVDELNSWLGVVVATLGEEGAAGELGALLTKLQRQLFVLGADLATPPAAFGLEERGEGGADFGAGGQVPGGAD